MGVKRLHPLRLRRIGRLPGLLQPPVHRRAEPAQELGDSPALRRGVEAEVHRRRNLIQPRRRGHAGDHPGGAGGQCYLAGFKHAHAQAGARLVAAAGDHQRIRRKTGVRGHLGRDRADRPAGPAQCSLHGRINAADGAQFGVPLAGLRAHHQDLARGREVGGEVAGEAADQEVGRAQVTPRPRVDLRPLGSQPGDHRQRQAGEGMPAAELPDPFGRAVPLPPGHQVVGPAVQPGDHRMHRVARRVGRDDRAGLRGQGQGHDALTLRPARDLAQCVQQRLPHLFSVLLHPARLGRQQRIGPAGGRHLSARQIEGDDLGGGRADVYAKNEVCHG